MDVQVDMLETGRLALVAAYVCRSSLLVMSWTVECQMSLVENSPARSMRLIITSVYHSRSGKNLLSRRSCMSSTRGMCIVHCSVCFVHDQERLAWVWKQLLTCKHLVILQYDMQCVWCEH